MMLAEAHAVDDDDDDGNVVVCRGPFSSTLIRNVSFRMVVYLFWVCSSVM